MGIETMRHQVAASLVLFVASSWVASLILKSTSTTIWLKVFDKSEKPWVYFNIHRADVLFWFSDRGESTSNKVDLKESASANQGTKRKQQVQKENGQKFQNKKIFIHPSWKDNLESRTSGLQMELFTCNEKCIIPKFKFSCTNFIH